MNFIVNQKKTEHGLLVIITDEDILGKKFVENKVQLDLTWQFYQGQPANTEEVIKLFAKARHLHLTGKAIVSLAVERHIVQGQKVLVVQGIPHAQVLTEKIS